jgi:hypothetical protein
MSVYRTTTGLMGANLDGPRRTPADWEPVIKKTPDEWAAHFAALSGRSGSTEKAPPPPSMRSAILKQRKAEAVAAHRKGDDREERGVTATSAQDNLRAAMQSRIPAAK